MKPCPFCGEQPKLREHQDGIDRPVYWYVECVNTACPAPARTVMQSTVLSACERWSDHPIEIRAQDIWECGCGEVNGVNHSSGVAERIKECEKIADELNL